MELSVPLVGATLAALAAIGFVSGFLGIGGGVLLIPLLTSVGRQAGLTDEAAIKQAMGTALFISSLTALSGHLVHRRRSAVPAPAHVPLAIAVAAGAFAGARTASELLEESLYPLFGVALLLAAAGFLLRRDRGRQDDLPGPVAGVAVGLPIGFSAAAVGLGGAVFTGLVFSGILGYPVRRVAAATSLAQALGGAAGWIGFALASPGAMTVAPMSLGWVHLPTGIVALLLTWPAARWGARVTHLTAPLLLRAVYAAVLAVLSLGFLLR